MHFVDVEGDDLAILPIGESRASDSTNSTNLDKAPLKSKLISNEVMDRCSKRAKKLRVELKRVAMENHN